MDGSLCDGSTPLWRRESMLAGIVLGDGFTDAGVFIIQLNCGR
jgi:hypothetical protein